MLGNVFQWFSKGTQEESPASGKTTIDGVAFSRLAANYKAPLEELEGVSLFHRKYGAGQIVRIQKRTGYMPLITVRFFAEPEDLQFNLVAFQNGDFPQIVIGDFLLSRLKNCPPEPVVPLTGTEDEELARLDPNFATIQFGRSGQYLRRGYHRVTHCWSCKRDDLDSEVHSICPECGGIICPHCGACLCSRR